jgi:hypothetical protein
MTLYDVIDEFLLARRGELAATTLVNYKFTFDKLLNCLVKISHSRQSAHPS